MTEDLNHYRDYGLVQQVRDLERRMAEDDNQSRDAEIARTKLEQRVTELEKQAASWTGGFWAIATTGTVITFVVAFWDKITFGLRR